jgi:hypothetical protein
MLLFYDKSYLDNVLKTLTAFARDTGEGEDTTALNTGASYRYGRQIHLNLEHDFQPSTSFFRRVLGQKSRLIHLESRLFIPIFASERLFPSQGNMELKLHFNSSEFLLMVGQDKPVPECKLRIERLDLKIRRIQLSEAAQNSVGRIMALEKRFLYNIIDYEV